MLVHNFFIKKLTIFNNIFMLFFKTPQQSERVVYLTKDFNWLKPKKYGVSIIKMTWKK